MSCRIARTRPINILIPPYEMVCTATHRCGIGDRGCCSRIGPCGRRRGTTAAVSLRIISYCMRRCTAPNNQCICSSVGTILVGLCHCSGDSCSSRTGNCNCPCCLVHCSYGCIRRLVGYSSATLVHRYSLTGTCTAVHAIHYRLVEREIRQRATHYAELHLWPLCRVCSSISCYVIAIKGYRRR